MSLVDVKHQAGAHRRIQRAIAHDRLPHAYLFHGPEGVGKEKLALGLARFLLCEEPVERAIDGDDFVSVGLECLHDGCGQCKACRSVDAGTHPDLHLIFRQLNREHPDSVVRKRKALDIGVDVLRHFVIETVGLTPTLNRAKVYVIREADRMNEAAQNALLKTLEEPPGTTMIILLAASTDRLLPTTLSRCQIVRFDALPTEFVRCGLADSGLSLSPEQTMWYAQVGAGSLGRAMEHAADKLFELNQRLVTGLTALASGHNDRSFSPGALTKTWIDESKTLGELHRKRDPEISDTEAGRRGLTAIFQLASTWFADLLRLRSDAGTGVVNASHRAELEASAAVVDEGAAIEAVNRLAGAHRQLDLNVNTQLCVEVLINDLAGLCRGTAASAV